MSQTAENPASTSHIVGNAIINKRLILKTLGAESEMERHACNPSHSNTF